MCGRFSVDDQDQGLDDVYQSLVGCPFPGVANLNTAPTETAWIVRVDSPAGGSLTALEAKWSLTPYWSETATPKYATFNARAETLATSRTFREPFRRRRCVVPVCGYYEWRKQAQPGLFEDDGRAAGSLAGSLKERTQTYFVRPRQGALLLAGVWDRWRRGRTGVDSFAVVTTAASDQLAFPHPRQPLSLLPKTRGFGCAPNGTARSWRGCSRHACRWRCLRRRCRATSATRATKAAAARCPLARRRSSPPTRDASRRPAGDGPCPDFE